MPSILPYRVAADIQRDYLDSGKLKAGDRLPTVRALQAVYGVSNGTIAHALTLLQEQGVIERHHGSGCIVCQASEDTGSKATDIMGLILSVSGLEITMGVYDGVDRACRSNGYHLMMASTNDNYETEREQLERMVSAGCKGVVLFPCSRTRTQLQNDYLRTEHRDLPIVVVDNVHAEQKRPGVLFDNYRACYEMTERLLQEGHKQIAFVDNLNMRNMIINKPTRDRYAGYIAALKSAGCTARDTDHWEAFDASSKDGAADLVPFLTNWKEQPERPTAVIALEDHTAVHIINVARRLGIAVPGDLRVLGFDHLSIGYSVSPPFATTRPDFVRAGEIAAQTVLRMIAEGTDESANYILPVPVVRWHSEIEREIMDTEFAGLNY